MDINEYIKTGIADGKLLADIYSEMSGRISKIDFYKTVLELVEGNQIPNVLVCYCGHDCSKCKTFHATLFDDNEMRKEIADYYKSTFGRDMSVNEIHCFSGRSDEVMQYCLECPFMPCSKEKGNISCNECSEYPCQTLEWYIKTYVNKANQV